MDTPLENHFGVRRNNLILKLPSSIAQASQILSQFSFIAPTFELQLRTVFSEGWHEVDHDLRYKCKDDWIEHSDLGRSLNGLAATLETCDWAAIQMFDSLAHRHYRARKWQACFRTKFRLRFQNIDLMPSIGDLLDSNNDVARRIYRIPRGQVIDVFWRNPDPLPVTIQNVIFIANRLRNVSDKLRDLEPLATADWLDREIGAVAT